MSVTTQFLGWIQIRNCTFQSCLTYLIEFPKILIPYFSINFDPAYTHRVRTGTIYISLHYSETIELCSANSFINRLVYITNNCSFISVKILCLLFISQILFASIENWPVLKVIRGFELPTYEWIWCQSW